MIYVSYVVVFTFIIWHMMWFDLCDACDMILLEICVL